MIQDFIEIHYRISNEINFYLESTSYVHKSINIQVYTKSSFNFSEFTKIFLKMFECFRESVAKRIQFVQSIFV